MLHVENITVIRDNNLIVDSFSCQVRNNATTALLGPSGSGKTTVLHAIAGLIPIDSGRIMIDDTDVTHIPTHRRKVGVVFQNNQLFVHMNVARNIEYGLKMAGVDKKTRQEKVKVLLDLVQLSGYEKRHVSTLSGGEAARVALARALAPSPRVLLLDEPFTGLDRDLHVQLRNDIGQLLRELEITCILVTHDREDATALAETTITI